MKNMKKVLASLLLVCMVCSMLAIPAAADGAGEIEVTLNRYGLPMAINEVYDLTGSVEPENVGNVNLLWSSSNEGVAAVDANGVVTALALGTADITASTADSLYSTVCQVIVADPVVYAESISLDMSELAMDIGGFATLTPTVYPENASVQRVMWLSSDENVVTVDENGNITALAEGTATVTAFAAELDLNAETLNEALMAKCQVHVIDRAAEAEAARLAEEEAARIAAEQAAAEAARLAEEEAARIAAEQAAAEAARLAEEEAARIAAEQAAAESTLVLPTVGVNSALEAPMSFASTPFTLGAPLSEGTLPDIDVEPYGTGYSLSTVELGDTYNLTATLSDASTHSIPYTWESSDPNVVSLAVSDSDSSKCVMTVVGPGSATVTVSRGDVANKAEVPITVVNDSVTISKGESQMFTDNYYQFEATGTYGDGSVIWSSSDLAVASVDASGLVKAEGKGTATITATSASDKASSPASASVDVTVSDPTVAVVGVSLKDDKYALTLTVGDSETLTAVVHPENATNQNVTWSSDKESVATVSNGTVTAVAPGTARITVTTEENGYKTICDVTVNPLVIPVTNVTLSQSTLSLAPGANNYSSPLIATVEPNDATDKSVTWSGSANGISVDENGVISVASTASEGATATITATSNADPSKSASCVVTVATPPVSVTGVTLDKDSHTLTMGSAATESFKLTATIAPGNATNQNVTWSSTNEAVATVDANGNVTALKDGTAVIIVSTEDGGKTATCTVTVKPKPAVLVTGIQIAGPGSSTTVGGTLQLSAVITPDTATNKAVTWSSNDTSIATIDQNGKLTGVSVGTAYITAAAKDGSGISSYPVAITITTAVPGTLYVSSNVNSISAAGGTAYLTARLADNSIVPNASINWTVSPADMATVSANGVVTPKRVGTFTVTGTFSANGVNYTGYTTIQMAPVIIYGNNSSYNGSNTPLYFVVNDLSSNARGVRVDGYTLTHGQHCYIYDHQGYIAVALNPAFLKTLSPSVVHTIQIDSANGTATGYFRIYGYSSAINGVKTGDENQAALWAALLFVSVIGMGAVLISRRKEWNG